MQQGLRRTRSDVCWRVCAHPQQAVLVGAFQNANANALTHQPSTTCLLIFWTSGGIRSRTLRFIKCHAPDRQRKALAETHIPIQVPIAALRRDRH